MNRRSFIRLGTQAAAVVPIWAAAPAFARDPRVRAAAQPVPAAVLRRIGITTVCFRERFTQTREKGAAPLAAGQ